MWKKSSYVNVFAIFVKKKYRIVVFVAISLVFFLTLLTGDAN